MRLGGEARGEPGLPHPRLAHDHDDRALPQLPRLPQRAELGRAAVYLASDDGNYVTGAYLRIDGGFVVGKY